MADILNGIAGVVWLAFGIYSFAHFRRLKKRMDQVISDLERMIEEDTP